MLLLIVGCAKPINDETLIDKDGLKYHPDINEIYSGKVFKNRMGGKKEFEGSYKDGKKDGLWTDYYENGQKRSVETYKDGKKDGLYTYWHEDVLMYEGTYKDGKEDGLWTKWYVNGQKNYEGTSKNGKREGLWTDYYENGQKMTVRTYNDGKLMNSEKCWDKNGIEKECG